MAETATTEKQDKKPVPTVEQQRLEELFGTLNAGDSIKVRHIVTDQKTNKNVRAICAILTDLQAVTDLERHIYDYGLEQGWESGEYMAELSRPGHHGAIKYGFFSFRFPPKPAATAAAVTSPLELVKQAKELLGATQQPQASPDTVLQSVTAAMKVGADAAGAKVPAADATAALFKPLIEGLVSRLGKEPPAAPDPWAVLKQLKDAGLIGQQTTDTGAPKPLVEQISELKELLDVVGDLRGPAGPTAEPTAVVVAKILAPYVPQVLHTVNNVVDVIRLRFGVQGPAMQPPGTAAAPPRAVGPPPMPPAVQVLVTRTQAAILSGDDGFFPAFAEGITTHIMDGRKFLLAIQRGELEEEQALVAVQGTGLLNPAEPRTRAWLIRFVHWLRAAQPMAAAEPSPSAGASPPTTVGAIAARCEKCQQEYRFDSREDFEQDTRICDSEVSGEFCKGNIVLLDSGEAIP